MSKTKRSKKYLFFAGLIMVAFSIFIEVLLISLRYEWMWTWYDDFREALLKLEDYITALDKSPEFVGAILLLFLIKSFFPIYPTSTVCLLTGIVLPFWLAIPVNMIGLGLQFTVKYFWGMQFGAGYAWKLLQKQEQLRRAIQSGGKGNPAVLLAIRLVPSIPVNLISSIYGSFSFGYLKFMIISEIGFLPKLVSFTIAGKNLFDPLSPGFLIPIMIISFVTGITALSANGVWNLVERFVNFYNKKHKKESIHLTDEEGSTEND